MSSTVLPNDIKELFRAFGKQGGNATKRKYGKQHFSQAGKLGMAKRWGGKKSRHQEVGHA